MDSVFAMRHPRCLPRFRRWRYACSKVVTEGLEWKAVIARTTDDRGEYRFRGLAAGKYYIGVEPKFHGWTG
jgi:hypothetical protein